MHEQAQPQIIDFETLYNQTRVAAQMSEAHQGRRGIASAALGLTILAGAAAFSHGGESTAPVVPTASGIVSEVVLDTMPISAISAAANCVPTANVTFYAEQAPENSHRFGPEQNPTTASEAYDRLIDTMCKDPARFVAETEFLGMSGTKTPAERDARVQAYMNNPTKWSEDYEVAVKFMDTAAKSLTSFTGDYHTYYQVLNKQTGRPEIHQSVEHMVDKKMLKMVFTLSDGMKITKLFKQECDEQPVQEKEFENTPQVVVTVPPKQETTVTTAPNTTTSTTVPKVTTTSSTSSSSTSSTSTSSTTIPKVTTTTSTTLPKTTTTSTIPNSTTSTSTSTTSTTIPRTTTTSSSTTTTRPPETSTTSTTIARTTTTTTNLGPKPSVTQPPGEVSTTRPPTTATTTPRNPTTTIATPNGTTSSTMNTVPATTVVSTTVPGPARTSTTFNRD